MKKRVGTLGNFLECVGKNYFEFSGNMKRGKYWKFIGVTVSIIVVLLLGAMYLNRNGETSLGNNLHLARKLFVIFMFLPIVSATTRRLHDTGRRTWQIIFLVAPIITGIIGITTTFHTLNMVLSKEKVMMIMVSVFFLGVTGVMPLYIFVVTLLPSESDTMINFFLNDYNIFIGNKNQNKNKK